jgi:hypothetical protein
MNKNTDKFTSTDNTTVNPFQNFEFSNFELFNSLASAKEKFSADDFFGKTGTFEFVFFSPFTEKTFTEFAEFFTNEIAPKVQRGSFLKFKFAFSNFDKQFEFAKFDEFFNQFIKTGSMVEFSFFSGAENNFTFDKFEAFGFEGFKSPSNFTNGDFIFFVRAALDR